MAILNITYNGKSADYVQEVDDDLSDKDIKRIVVEAVNSKTIPAFGDVAFTDWLLEDYVVDRFTNKDIKRFYLRPKVPFGQEVA